MIELARNHGLDDNDLRRVEGLIKEHEQEIRDAAAELRKVSRKAWRRPATRLALGIAGAAWTVASGELVPGAIALAGALLGSELGPRRKADAYLYFNNDWEGFAIRNALWMRKRLGV